jgi:hypothetical protein
MNKLLAFLFSLCLVPRMAATPVVDITNDTQVTTWSDSFSRAQYGQRQNFEVGSYFISYYPQYFVSYRDHSQSGSGNPNMVSSLMPKYGLPDIGLLAGRTNMIDIFYPSDNGGLTSNQMYGWFHDFIFKYPTNTYDPSGNFTNDFPIANIASHHQMLVWFDGIYYSANGGFDSSQLKYNAGAGQAAIDSGVPYLNAWVNMSNAVVPMYPANSNLWFNPPLRDHPADALQGLWFLCAMTNLGIDSNTFSCTIDLTGATVRSTNHLTIGGIQSLGGGRWAITNFHADRMAPALYHPDGTTTNDLTPWAWIPGSNPLTNAFQEMLCFTNLMDGQYKITMDSNYVFYCVATNGRLDINLWNNYTNAFQAQGQAILYLLCDLISVSHADQSSDLTPGVNVNIEQYESYARARYPTNGPYGNAYYINLMADRETTLDAVDVTIHAAAQQTNHTFVIQRSFSYVDQSALLPVQSSQLYSVAIGDSPDDGSVQSYNPPIFTWIYAGDHPNTMATDLHPRTFQFQLSTNAGATFSSLYWNFATSNNCYNFLAPITNSDGSTWLGTNYWRVIYYSNDLTTVLGTGSVHNFTISSSAVNWDRSILADSNYLYGVLSPHPHFLFNAGNRTAVSNYLKGTSYWLTFSNAAVSAVGQSWWNNASVYTNQSQSASIQNDIQSLYAVALMYQMSSDPFWANQHPETMFDLYVQQWINLDQMHQEPYTGGTPAFQQFPIVADWLWPILSDATRSNTVYAMEESVKFYVFENWWFEDSGNYVTNFYNWNTRQAGYSSAFKTGNSHARYDVGPALLMSLCCWTNSPTLRSLLEYPLNYSLAVKDYARGDEGRGYNLNNFQAGLNWGANLVTIPLLTSAHPERAPYFQKLLQFYSYSEPLNYRGFNEPWGDLGYGIGPEVQGAPLYHNEYLMDEFAAYTGNGAALQQAARQDSNPSVTKEFEWASGYYNSNPPTQIDWPSNNYVDTLWGYAVMGDHQPSDYGAFTNGVAVMTQARPGPRMEHGNPTDGGIQMWAYGAQITAGGTGGYRKHPMYASGMTFVDGIGSRGGVYANPQASWYSRFTAFTNAPDFSFIADDTTKSYPSNALTGIQFQQDYWPFYSYSTNARPYLTSMNHYVLFPHGKYLVLYDTMTSSQAARFQWVWHSLEPTMVVNTNACSFIYTCTNISNGSNVTVYAVPGVDSAAMTLTNLPVDRRVLTLAATDSHNIDGLYGWNTTFTWNGASTWTNAQYGVYSNANLCTLTNGAGTVLFNVTNSQGTNLYTRVGAPTDPLPFGQFTYNAYRNPFTGETYSDGQYFYLSYPAYNGNVWVYNKTPATSWHFMWVIYPAKWGQPAPTITRITDNTMEVNDGVYDDIFSFGETNNSPPSTIVISAALLNGGDITGGGGQGNSGNGLFYLPFIKRP